MSITTMTVFLGLFVFLAYALTQALREARRQREARHVGELVMVALGAVTQVAEALAAVDRASPTMCARRPQPATMFDRFLADEQGGACGGGPCSS